MFLEANFPWQHARQTTFSFAEPLLKNSLAACQSNSTRQSEQLLGRLPGKMEVVVHNMNVSDILITSNTA